MAVTTSSLTLEDLMNNFHKEIGQENLKEIMKKFNGEETIQDMFKALWSIEEAHKCLTPSLIQSKKSNEEANKLRGLGNDHLVQRHLNKALEMFNMSIMAAPHPDIEASEEQNNSSRRENTPHSSPEGAKDYETLSLCYARRSAVLFELQNYDLCLSDITRANGCQKLQSELEERRKKCVAIQESQRNDKKTQSAKSIEIKASPSVPELTEPNPIMPSYSSACKIAYMREKGRHIIAAKNIRPGEVILVEKAYCSSPYFENLATYCSTCLRECLAPLPCPNCSMIVFCSPACREKGLSGYHWRECNILPTMFELDMMPTFSNVYKVLGTGSCNQWRTTLQRIEEVHSKCSPETDGINQNNIFSSEDFNLFYSMRTNATERPCGDLYVKCLIAFVLTKLLQLGGRLFVDESCRPVSPEEGDLLFIGQFFFSNLMKISCNGASIYDFQCTMPPFKIIKRDIGAGVFPSFSLINHSCHPSALPYFYGHFVVIRAARTLSEGDEITLGYCRGSYLQPVEDRQIYLDNVYQFECCCEACEGNWPTYKELSDKLHIKCLVCSQAASGKDFRCTNCACDYSVEGKDESEQKMIKKWKSVLSEAKEAQDTIQNLMETMMEGAFDLSLDLTVIRNAVQTLEKYVPPPSPVLWDARDTLELFFHLEKNLSWT